MIEYLLAEHPTRFEERAEKTRESGIIQIIQTNRNKLIVPPRFAVGGPKPQP